MKLGLLGALGVLFIGLKLTGYITWSWWLVLLPLYTPTLIFALCCCVSLVIYALVK